MKTFCLLVLNRSLKYFLFILFASSVVNQAFAMVNPITDICWECLFPIYFSGVNVTPKHKDLAKHKEKPVCTCPGNPPTVGIPLTFWEPLYLMDVTTHAYKLVGLGGMKLASETFKNRGCIGKVDEVTHYSNYHVHFYEYPIFALLDLFTDFLCVKKSELSLPYMSEFDITWSNESIGLLLSGEALLFASPAAQMSCLADGMAANGDKPLDELFWCAGCMGSLYPLTGYVAHHSGPLQASSLLMHRFLAKWHRCLQLKGFKAREFCQAKYQPLIKKSQYKTQLVYPIPQTKGSCQPLGKSDVLWGAKKSLPGKGDEFVYLIWQKKHCCLDLSRPALMTTGAGI